MYAVVDNDTIKFEILPPSDSRKALLCFKKRPGGSDSRSSLQARKLAVDGRLLLCLHDVVFVGHGQHVLSPLVLAVVSVHDFRAVAYVRC